MVSFKELSTKDSAQQQPLSPGDTAQRNPRAGNASPGILALPPAVLPFYLFLSVAPRRSQSILRVSGPGGTGLKPHTDTGCPSSPPPEGCPAGDSPAGQVGAQDDSRLWGRLQLPRGWADTGALHTAGGDTSPPHNSWQRGQRRPRSRRGSTRWREGRHRHHRGSCCTRCSCCYCCEGGSSAASGSTPGASSGGVGNQRRPMRGHLHFQPLRVPPPLALI